MIDCIIIDDEQHAIDLLEHYVSKVPYLNLVASTTDPIAGLAMLNRMQSGLVFLDVQMPQLSGIEMLKLIKNDVRVVMTTAYKEYAFEGFQYEVVDYLLKPVDFPRFLKAVNRLVTPHQARTAKDNVSTAYLFVKTEQKGKFVKIDVQNITFIEALGNYVAIHQIKQQRVITYMSLKELDDRLSNNGFIRVHKSFIISFAHVITIEGNLVKVLEEDRLIPIGSAYKQDFFKLLNKNLLSPLSS
jgi:DNA-binding LytR/AlgR family response regulator